MKNLNTKNTAGKKAWETPAIFNLDTKDTEGKTLFPGEGGTTGGASLGPS